MNRKKPIAPWGAQAIHVRTYHGKCPVCGHYGDYCTGTEPAETYLKDVIDLYPRALGLLKAVEPWLVKGIEKGAYVDCVRPSTPARIADQIQALLKQAEQT